MSSESCSLSFGRASLVWSGLCYCNIVFGKGVNLIFPVIALSMCPELWSLHKLNII